MFKKSRLFGAVSAALLVMGASAANAQITGLTYKPSIINKTYEVIPNSGTQYTVDNVEYTQLANDGSFIAEARRTPSHTYRWGFYWSNDTTLHELPWLGIYGTEYEIDLDAYAINSQGKIVGFFRDHNPFKQNGPWPVQWDTQVNPISINKLNLIDSSDNGFFSARLINDSNLYAGWEGVDLALFENNTITSTGISAYHSPYTPVLSGFNNNASVIAHATSHQPDHGAFIALGTYKSKNGSIVEFKKTLNGGNVGFLTPLEINDGEIVAGEYREFNGQTQTTQFPLCGYENMNTRAAFNFNGQNFGYGDHTKCVVNDINNNGIVAATVIHEYEYAPENPRDPTKAWKHEALLVDTSDNSAVNVKSLLDLTGTDFTESDFDNIRIAKINDNGDLIVYKMNLQNESVTSSVINYYLKAQQPLPELTLTADNSDSTSNWSKDWLITHGSPRIILPLAGEQQWGNETVLTPHAGSDYAVAKQSGTSREFVWNIDVAESRSNYAISATWPIDGNNDGNVNYKIYVDGVEKGSYYVDQTQVGTADLGSLNIEAGSKLAIKLTGSGQGNLIADQVKAYSAN